MENILVVDDEKDMRFILKQNFEAEGFNCMVAQDGREALKIAKENQPSLIILDLMMPEMDGLQIYKALKADNTTKNIPIIAYTAQDPETVVPKGQEALDIVDFVLKPSDAAALILAAKKALKRKSKH